MEMASNKVKKNLLHDLHKLLQGRLWKSAETSRDISIPQQSYLGSLRRTNRSMRLPTNR